MFKMNYTNKMNINPSSINPSSINKLVDILFPILITFSTCWYIVKSKFPVEQYLEWINNLFSIVNNFNLVIYTDIDGFNSLKTLFQLENYIKKKDQIKIIIKPMNEFYGYRYKADWIKNHNSSQLLLHKMVDWQLNMLWCEKIHFVNETICNDYFTTKYYGWCDIGYFRNLSADKLYQLKSWPSPLTLLFNFPGKIHYGCVQDDQIKYNGLREDIVKHYVNNNKTISNFNPIPINKIEETCFAGGFFILTRPLAEIYGKIFDIKLQYYFRNNFIVKDDQQIIMDCIFTNPQLFCVHFSSNWFMFQEMLL